MSGPSSGPAARRAQVTGAAACVVVGAFAGAAHAADCGSLAGKTWGPATITAATSVAPPSSLLGKDPPVPVSIKAPFCRVQGTIKPSSDSDISFEVWLPPEGAWNGKFQAVGNGGFAGSLVLNPMTWALEAGYAVAATDTGHSGGPGDTQWALGHPEKIVDFGWRAVHETAAASKAIVAEYYGKAPAHAYFNGCSDGGREALMEAQRFPKDFDGIVAGAPANNWTHLLTNGVATKLALDRPNAWLSPEKLSLVTKAVLAACHGADGFLDDPSQCHFDPASLVCKAGQSDACLSEPEAAALRQVYAGSHDASGKPIFPGYAFGGESGQTAWPLWITGGEPNRTNGTITSFFATGYFANLVFDKPDWRIDGASVDDALAAAIKKTGPNVDSTDPDLSAFKAAGGKIVQFHGWHDPAIPPQSSINYYQSVVDRMGGPEAVKSFYRLFMAPGMEHCGGGPGPNAVGAVFALPSPSRDPQHDVVAAVAHWVEDGVAPDQLVATRYKDNDPGKGVEAQRPWCVYPEVARYAGQGERKDAASFACVAAGP